MQQAVLEPIADTNPVTWDLAVLRRRPPLITPAHVLGRSSCCQAVVSEGDWLCDHLAATFGHQVARLTDRPAR
jgi:hypothetical protein